MGKIQGAILTYLLHFRSYYTIWGDVVSDSNAPTPKPQALRKRLVTCLALALFAVSCGSSSSTEVLGESVEADSALSQVRFGGQFYPGDFVLKGDPSLWGESDVQHTLFSSGTENNQALISGDIDINVGSDSKSASLFAAIPDDAVIIAIMQRGDRYSTIVNEAGGYTDWASLKGETVATRLGSGAEQVLQRYFAETDGLAWDDFEWVNLKIEEMVPALQNGSIEAFTAWEPTPAIAEAQGVGVAMRSYGDVALVPVAMHTTIDYATNNREEIIQFLEAHIKKVDLIESDPNQAAQLAADAASAQGSDVGADAFLRIFERVDFSLAIDDEALASIDDTVAFLFASGSIDSVPSIRHDSSFLEEAIQRAN